VETVARKLVRRDVIPDVAALRALGKYVSDEVSELLLCSGDVLTSMQEGRKLAAVLLALVRNDRVGFKHRFEALGSVARSVPDFS
jgi:hypothetical protein